MEYEKKERSATVAHLRLVRTFTAFVYQRKGNNSIRIFQLTLSDQSIKLQARPQDYVGFFL